MDNVLEIGMGNYIIWETEVPILKEEKKRWLQLQSGLKNFGMI